MKVYKTMLSGLLLLAVSGCKPIEIPAELITDARECVSDVHDTELAYQATKQAQAAHRPLRATYKVELNKLVAEVVMALKEVALKTDSDAHAKEYRKSVIGCGNQIVAYLQTTEQISTNRHATSRKALGVTAILGGIYASGWALENIVKAGSGTTGDSWNVSGSRVVSKSGNDGGNASASGEGLISLPVTGGTDATGGFLPRNQRDVTNSSNSGEEGGNSLLPAPVPEPAPAP